LGHIFKPFRRATSTWLGDINHRTEGLIQEHAFQECGAIGKNVTSVRKNASYASYGMMRGNLFKSGRKIPRKTNSITIA
jgi:hypothetical protein